MILLHIHDEGSNPPPNRRFDASWTIVALSLDDASDLARCEMRHCLIDVDVALPAKAIRVQALLERVTDGGRLIFACPSKNPKAVIQACRLGATRIIDRPVRDDALRHHLADVHETEGTPPSTVLGSLALDFAFQSITEAKALPSRHLEDAASSIAEDIACLGVDTWLRSVRDHHVGTYQHCLLVTGLATAFGQHMGLSSQDLQKFTVAALLHDVGKARIDLAILDKTGPLTPEERATIQMHPVWGEEHLLAHGNVSDDIRACVRHHHEMLDGSGYPDRLRGSEISDLTRLLTIVDVFGALIEKRSYKPPMSGEAAYGVLRRMADEGKLEMALVKAFRPVASRFSEQPVRLLA